MIGSEDKHHSGMDNDFKVEIRKSQNTDYSETENVIREAFWNVYCPGCSEHYLVHVMRESPEFIPELDFVATHNEKIVGNIVYMKAHIKCDDGRKITDVISLGPIGIIPELQRKGIGHQLIYSTKEIARKMNLLLLNNNFKLSI